MNNPINPGSESTETESTETESTETVRKLIVPDAPNLEISQVEAKDSDRSPTKTERDTTIEAIANAAKTTAGEVEVVRKLVTPEMLASEIQAKDDDRSPTKTERDVDMAVISKKNQELA